MQTDDSISFSKLVVVGVGNENKAVVGISKKKKSKGAYLYSFKASHTNSSSCPGEKSDHTTL